MLQIQDDLFDCMAQPTRNDWLTGDNNLFILYGKLVDYEAKARFLELLSQVSDGDLAVLEEAQQILIDAGAVAYCDHVLKERLEQVQGRLQTAVLPNDVALLALVEEVATVVDRL